MQLVRKTLRPFSDTEVRKFWRRVNWRGQGSDDCWLWDRLDSATAQGTNGLAGQYGVYIGWRAHALAKFIDDDQRPPPHGMGVCHTCDTPRCCNPRHLFYGTAKDNHDDMVAKGRQRKPGPGKRLSRSVKLEIQQSRQRIATLSRRHGVSRGTIKRILGQGRTLENQQITHHVPDQRATDAQRPGLAGLLSPVRD